MQTMLPIRSVAENRIVASARVSSRQRLSLHYPYCLRTLSALPYVHCTLKALNLACFILITRKVCVSSAVIVRLTCTKFDGGWPFFVAPHILYIKLSRVF